MEERGDEDLDLSSQNKHEIDFKNWFYWNDFLFSDKGKTLMVKTTWLKSAPTSVCSKEPCSPILLICLGHPIFSSYTDSSLSLPTNLTPTTRLQPTQNSQLEEALYSWWNTMFFCKCLSSTQPDFNYSERRTGSHHPAAGTQRCILYIADATCSLYTAPSKCTC